MVVLTKYLPFTGLCHYRNRFVALGVCLWFRQWLARFYYRTFESLVTYELKPDFRFILIILSVTPATQVIKNQGSCWQDFLIIFDIITGHLHWTRKIPPPRQRRDQKLRTLDRQVITKVFDTLSLFSWYVALFSDRKFEYHHYSYPVCNETLDTIL